MSLHYKRLTLYSLAYFLEINKKWILICSVLVPAQGNLIFHSWRNNNKQMQVQKDLRKIATREICPAKEMYHLYIIKAE